MTSSIDLSTVVWRKSSYSNGDGGNCVETGSGVPGAVPVRDSKDVGRSALVFSAESWAGFVSAVRAGRFEG